MLKATAQTQVKVDNILPVQHCTWGEGGAIDRQSGLVLNISQKALVVIYWQNFVHPLPLCAGLSGLEDSGVGGPGVRLLEYGVLEWQVMERRILE